MPIRLVGVPWDVTTLGRKGARLGPEAIRRELARLHPFDADQGVPVSWLPGKDLALGESHADMVRSVAKALEAERERDPASPTLLLGGDHAIGYAGVAAHRARHHDIAVVSLDAHLDLRPLEGGPSNGNWAHRIVDEFHVPFWVLGTGRFSNEGSLYDTARRLGVNWVPASRLRHLGVEAALGTSGLDKLAGKDLYVSVDMDVLDQALAPGVSAPTPDGLALTQLLEILAALQRLGRVRGYDLAEVNPAVDPSGLTARMAAHVLLAILSLPPPMSEAGVPSPR